MRVILKGMGKGRQRAKEIKDAAYKQGFFTLADDGVRHIIEGITSIKEVARVADLTERMD